MRSTNVHTIVRGVAMAILTAGMLQPADARPRHSARPVHLNLIWHQHQPLYVDPAADQLTGPWVRAHATKDYYDMAAMLREYPGIHCTFNLTSSLLVQLQEYYVARLTPFIDFGKKTIDAPAFLQKWRGKTDPWIDLMLTPTSKLTPSDKDQMYRNPWNCFGISEIMIGLFPEYRKLREKLPRGKRAPDNLYTEQELRELKFWFFCAWFDPDFLQGPVTLQDGSTCDLSGFVERGRDGKARLRRPVTERDCQRLVVEAARVMANVVPVHAALRYDPASGAGQCDIITTPYYHPILPLIYDSDLARICQPNDTLPGRFAYPEDAEAQVRRAVAFYTRTFGIPPEGMWPGEGSVAQEILPILRRNGIRWTASDVKVLLRSKPEGMQNNSPYRFPAGDGPIAIVFRDTDLSDRIGFTYQEMDAERAAEDFVQSVLARAPKSDAPSGVPDALVTVILDGENAWEWYRSGDDGKAFLHALYRKLTRLQEEGRLVTTTVSEYIQGNAGRGIAPHPVESLPEMEWLWPGSWINGNYDTWIGEEEENRAWALLAKVRRDLATTGIPPPDPAAPEPRHRTDAWYAYKAWEAMYAAEGSDWFWWYGNDQTAPGSEVPLDRGFLTHLKNVYLFARKAGASVTIPKLRPILESGSRAGGRKKRDSNAGGTMAR